jgi:hypothetical protein
MSPAWARTQKNPSWAPAEQSGPLRTSLNSGLRENRAMGRRLSRGVEPRRAHKGDMVTIHSTRPIAHLTVSPLWARTEKNPS